MIKCQDCNGIGQYIDECDRGCCVRGYVTCVTCKGFKKVNPDNTERYWAKKYYSLNKKKKIKQEQFKNKILNLQHEIEELEYSIKEYKKEIIKDTKEKEKIKKKLEKLLNK